MKVLGIRQGHDAAAAVVENGQILASVAEERLSRIKNDTSFPIRAINKVLELAGWDSEEIDALAVPARAVPGDFEIFFDYNNWPSTPRSTLGAAKDLLYSFTDRSKKTVLPLYQKPLKLRDDCQVHCLGHHFSHAASAYLTSGFTEETCLISVLDGVGDGVSVSLWKGEGGKIELLKEWNQKSSLGWMYANATEALHWRHGSDEWKLMGLAPYGKASPGAIDGYHPIFKDGELIQEHDYGEFGRWNDHGANHYHGKDSVPLQEVVAKLGRENFAAEVQRVAEEQAFEIIVPWLKKLNTRNLCCAGGFFLNVKFNQHLWESGVLDKHWIYPNAGDAGIAAGAALATSVIHGGVPMPSTQVQNMYLGPEFSDAEIEEVLKERGLAYKKSTNVAADTANYLQENMVIGWFQGRMEDGPRALGSRSILMSPLRAENKDIINAKVKFREAFRPFCPSMLHAHKSDYFEGARDENFMTTSFAVKEEKRNAIPAVVHEDGTARPQLVTPEQNPLYAELIECFKERTGEAVILNTSFNVKGEPIVCTPREAIKCFFDTGIDILVLGSFILEKPVLGAVSS